MREGLEQMRPITREPTESIEAWEARLWAEAERVRLINLPAIEARRKAYRKAATT